MAYSFPRFWVECIRSSWFLAASLSHTLTLPVIPGLRVYRRSTIDPFPNFPLWASYHLPYPIVGLIPSPMWASYPPPPPSRNPWSGLRNPWNGPLLKCLPSCTYSPLKPCSTYKRGILTLPEIPGLRVYRRSMIDLS